MFTHPSTSSESKQKESTNTTVFLKRKEHSNNFIPPVIQTKLTIGQPNDKYEKEADQVADMVMKMPADNSSETIQRKCDDCEEEKIQKKPLVSSLSPMIQTQKGEEEEEMLQAKGIGNTNQSPSTTLESSLQKSKGSGQAMDATTQSSMEGSIGTDFSKVKIHTNENAVQMNRSLGAKAFTNGNDIYFNSGQYKPKDAGGKHLLAHELAHVVQQKGANTIQRKILVGGKPYTPTAKYLTWLKGNFGDAMVEFMNSMHNGGNAPDFSFASLEEMGYEVRIRSKAIDGMGEVHKGCCGYAPAGQTGKLDSTYWDKKAAYHFLMKTPLPSGKTPSDAIKSIFKNGAGTLLECNSTMVAIQYRAMMLGMGEDKFNKKFPNGTGILISPHHTPQAAGVAVHPIWDKKLYKSITISSAADLLPGDWVYFKNVPDYSTKHPTGAWTGEHAMYLGNGKFRGFGVKEQTEDELNKELLKAYNDGLATADQKKITDVIGLKDYARRPVVQEIMK